MLAQERQDKIEELLKEKSSLKVSEISELCNVSESTIRRDLQEMEEKNILMRTHGGAVWVNRTNFEPTFISKKDERNDEKRKIALIATRLIEDGDTIILDSGTTTLEIARLIENKSLTVITNSIDIAAELAQKEHIETVVTGGSIRLTTRAMVGHVAEAMLRNFRVDKAFIGANGISLEDGITTPNSTEAQTKKAMMNSASKVIFVADSSKFNNVCFSVICPVKAASAIITSSDIDDEIVETYKEIGVDVITE